MTRIEENENMIQRTKMNFHGKTDDVLCQIKGQELGVLVDISKSLAVIADVQLEYLHSETEPPMVDGDPYIDVTMIDTKVIFQHMVIKDCYEAGLMSEDAWESYLKRMIDASATGKEDNDGE